MVFAKIDVSKVDGTYFILGLMEALHIDGQYGTNDTVIPFHPPLVEEVCFLIDDFAGTAVLYVVDAEDSSKVPLIHIRRPIVIVGERRHAY